MPENREGSVKEPTPKARKWWRDSRYIAAIGAALAGVASFNPGLNNWLTYSLESTKQETSRRDAYLERAIDPQRTEAYRLSVLQYLVSTLPDRDAMKTWAKEQLEILQALELEKRRINLERLKDSIASEIATREKALSKTKPTSPEWKKAEEAIERLKGQVDDLKVQLDKTVKAAADIRPAPLIVNPSPAPPVVESNSKTNLPTRKESDRTSEKNRSEDQSGPIVRGARECCITCFGLQICGYVVETPCGRCEAGN